MADYTDNFNRANVASSSTSITGGPYPITVLTGSFELLSNTLHDTDTGAVVDSWCRMEVDFQSSDHEVSVRLSTVTLNGATAVGAGPMISLDTNASVTGFFVIADFVAQTMTILDLVGGVVTNSYGTSAGLGAFAVGDVLTLGRQGAYIYAKKNGATVIDARSSLYYTNKRGGVYTSRSSALVDVAVNYWYAHDLVSAPIPPRSPGLPFPLGMGLVVPTADVVSAAPTVTGTLATTNADDTLAASGSTVTGTVAKTNANDTLAGSGGTGPSGTLAKTNNNDTLAGTGGTGPSGSLARTNNNDTLAAAGSSTTGTLAKTNANDNVSAAGGTGPSGTLARTNANDTLAASGGTGPSGTLARTNADDTLAASGAVSGGGVTGSASTTNANDRLTADGAFTGLSAGGLLRYGRVDTSDRRDILSTLARDEEDALLLVLIGASL